MFFQTLTDFSQIRSALVFQRLLLAHKILKQIICHRRDPKMAKIPISGKSSFEPAKLAIGVYLKLNILLLYLVK